MGVTDKQKWLIFFAVGIIMFGISFYSHQREKMMVYEVSGKEDDVLVESNQEDVFDKTQETLLEKPIIMVHVEGAVVSPGLYELKEGDRLADAIEVAGGLTEKAEGQQINLAMKIQDGTQVYIPAKDENMTNKPVENRVIPLNNKDTTSNSLSGTGKININEASLKELTQLKGIGDALAERIIEYRQQQGPFKSIEEIKNVSGIGDKKFLQFKDVIITN